MDHIPIAKKVGASEFVVDVSSDVLRLRLIIARCIYILGIYIHNVVIAEASWKLAFFCGFLCANKLLLFEKDCNLICKQKGKSFSLGKT